MKVSLVTSALVVGAMVCAAVSLAVAPQPGKVYIGDIKSSPFTMHVSVTVAKSGKSATFTYLCGTGRPPTTVYSMPIDSTGHFNHAAKAGDWKMAGHFTSATTGFISVNSIACGGSKGSTNIKLKP
jgi:hypothetical protein